MSRLEKKDISKSKVRGSGPKKGSGGKRTGAGRKKGSKNLKTILKEEAARELAEKNMYKAELLKMLPPNLQRSEKALTKAIKELNEEEIEETFKKRIALHSNRLLTAQLDAALGEKYVYKCLHKKDSNGRVTKKHVRVTDPDEIQHFLDNPLLTDGDDYMYITTKEANVNAIDSIMDRFLGRPTSKVVGPKNPDGSEGPIKVIVANFGAQQEEQAGNAGHIAGEIVQEVIEAENGS